MVTPEMTPDMGNSSSYLPYHEPSILTILIQSSFLLVLNALNSLFDSLIYCGLLAQVFVGVAWGTPGGQIISREFENVVVQLGYLGLLLLVYEGGLSTNFTTLKSNLLLSILVALTGIIFPIAFSFTLGPILGASPVQCFAAGAALCATSLGTTFTILRTSGLAKTRLGVVLASAAMMDDVIGLVMVQVISNLGTSSGGTFSWRTVVRPLGVSLAFAVVVPLGCWGVVKPVTGFLNSKGKGVVKSTLEAEFTPFIIHTAVLLGLITGASYAGTSNLFAAYLAGAAVSWWDSEVNSPGQTTSQSTFESQNEHSPTPPSAGKTTQEEGRATSGNEVFEKFYATALHRILKPFFFASIGFAIPITEMFTGTVLWRGIVYTIMMLFGKLVTGLWLVRLDISKPKITIPTPIRKLLTIGSACLPSKYASSKAPKSKNEPSVLNTTNTIAPSKEAVTEQPPPSPSPNPTTQTPSSTRQSHSTPLKNPLSLYPASILGTAMTARGEIGFLISSLAATTGIFDHETYLVVTWAILLCTIIGPLAVGTLVRRVKRLEEGHGGRQGGGNRDGVGERRVDGPLGVWGVS